MSGRKKVVQARIKEKPRALFNHCNGLFEITFTIRLSNKSWQRDPKLEKIRQASGEEGCPNVRQLCQT